MLRLMNAVSKKFVPFLTFHGIKNKLYFVYDKTFQGQRLMFLRCMHRNELGLLLQ